MKAFYILAFLGVCVLAIAILPYQSTRHFLNESAKTTGTVIELRPSRSGSTRTYLPIVQFNSPDGRTFTFAHSVSSYPPSFSEGQKVEVLYRKTNPQDAKIQGFFSLWIGTFILGIIGTMFLTAAGIALVIHRKFQKNETRNQCSFIR